MRHIIFKQSRKIKSAFPTLLFNGSNRCEVAKLAFCSEDVKTAALPPCEVAPDGGGCVENNILFKRYRNTPAAFQRESPPPAPTPLPKARGEIEGGRYVIADGMIGVFGEGAVFDETEDEIP